jgi:DNA-binding LacI/PurR family transcriptional regulator
MVLQDEFMAHEAFHACRRLGLEVPDDLSLVSLADSLPRSHPVPLSAPDTITTWTDAIRRATEHLVYLLQSGKDRVLDMTFHSAIHWKASTGKSRTLATVE